MHVYVDNTDPARPVVPIPDEIRAAVAAAAPGTVGVARILPVGRWEINLSRCGRRRQVTAARAWPADSPVGRCEINLYPAPAG